MIANSVRRVLALVVVLLLSLPAHAELSLQFSPVLPGLTCSSTSSCSVAGGIFSGAKPFAAGNDGTRFYQEKLYINGVNYFHVIIGSIGSGFALESYIATENVASSNVLKQSTNPRPFAPSGGGNERALMGNQDVVKVGTEADALAIDGLFGNGRDPFGVTVDKAGFKSYDLSGNGTQDPRLSAFRMVVGDAQVSMEVLKPLLGRKPLIVQTTNDAEMSALFKVDMRGLSYSESARAALVINRLTLNSAALPADGVADFDMSMVQRSYVTAGRYTYQAGRGWEILLSDGSTTPNTAGWDKDDSVFDEGVYTYTNGTGGFALDQVKWESFFDYSQNSTACSASASHRPAVACP